MSYFSLNAKSIVLAKTLATASLLATVVQILPAQAATLVDWGSVESANSSLFNSSGRFVNATNNNIALSGGGTFNLTFGTIANITTNAANPSRLPGITSQFVSNTPSVDHFLNGTLPNTSPSLYLQQNSTSVNQAIYAGIKFNNPGGVNGLTFTLFDIDKSSNSLASGSWQDRVIVRGLFNGVAVLPTTVSAVSTFLNASTGNISVNGAGANYAGAIIDGATVLDGTKGADNDTSNNGNVTISFAGPVDQLYIDFTQASGSLSGSNPASHGIGIGNMTYQAVPEPLTLLGAATAIAFGTAFKRRSAQSKNRD